FSSRRRHPSFSRDWSSDVCSSDLVSYHSMPRLTLDEAQKVTIHSVEYIEKADVQDDAPHDRFDTGVLVISLTWETLKGSVQSNQDRKSGVQGKRVERGSSPTATTR